VVQDPVSATQYLTVTGVLHPDNRLDLDPGFLTSEPAYAAEDPTSALVAELLDDQGKLLLRYRLPFGAPCTDGVAVHDRLVGGKVPFPSSTRLIRFLLDNVPIHEVQVPRQSPIVNIRWDPKDSTDGEQKIAWTGEHPDGLRLTYLVSYSADNGRSWEAVGLPTSDAEQIVDFRRLPGGRRCRLRVLATDGVNNTAAMTPPFERATQPCYAMILSPDNDAEFQVGETIRLQGQGYYLEERQPELEMLDWTSSRSGSLGRGAIVEWPARSPGAHEITLSAGREGRVGTARVTVRIG
jgi:hypothetical protein